MLMTDNKHYNNMRITLYLRKQDKKVYQPLIHGILDRVVECIFSLKNIRFVTLRILFDNKFNENASRNDRNVYHQDCYHQILR